MPGKAEEIVVTEDALRIYKKALAHKSDCELTLFAKGNLLMKKGSFGEAVLCFYKLIPFQGKNPELYNNIGLCLMQLNNYELAESFLQKAVMLKPKDAVYAYNYGLVVLKRGDFEKAIAILSKHVKEERAEIFSSLGYCYSSLGKYEEIYNFIKGFVDSTPSKRKLSKFSLYLCVISEHTKALEILKSSCG